MQVVSPSIRKPEPESIPLETLGSHGQVKKPDSQSKSCLWSFCSGRDSELPSSPDEKNSLINLKEVHISYGAPASDTDQGLEVSWESCTISDAAYNTAAGIVKTVAGLALTALAVTGAVWGHQMLNSKFPGEFETTFYPALMLVPGALAMGMTAWGVKDLVEVYKECGNA